jgi:hypothetical protein
MDPIKQRTAIAEACGWKMYCQEAINGNWGTKDKWITAPDGTSQFRHNIPDYLNDLNSMHDAENEMTLDEQDKYAQLLAEMFHGPGWSFALIHATAAQRVEAFLRTIGKWEDL